MESNENQNEHAHNDHNEHAHHNHEHEHKNHMGTSVLKTGDHLRKRQESFSPSLKKRVMFDVGSTQTSSRSSFQNIEILRSNTHSHRKRNNSTGITKKMSITYENSFVEIIDENGVVKKEKIKGQNNEEFNKNRNKKYVGEFSKAQEFYNKNKEKEEIDDNLEDTVTNTMRNQFAGKLDVLDSGTPHAPFKDNNVA